MTGKRTRTLMVAATCAAVGAGGGIVGSMAAPAKHRTKTATAKRTAGRPPGRDPGDLHHGGPGRGPVHAEEVVLDKAGTAFITATEDSGKVKSVSGNDVTIAEGTDKVAYKDVTVTIPDGATVVRDGATAKVGDIQAGDFVHVSRSSDGTFVFAADPSWQPPGDGHGFGRPDGPPPAGAPAPPQG